MDDGPRTFDVSADGRRVVMEVETDLYLMEDGGELRLVDITVPASDRFDPVERHSFTSGAGEYAVSPDGQSTAFVVRGEQSITRNDSDESRTVRLTDSPYRAPDVVWADDHTVLFASDRTGEYDLQSFFMGAAGPPARGQRPDGPHPRFAAHTRDSRLARHEEIPRFGTP